MTNAKNDKAKKPDYINSLYYKDGQGNDQRIDFPASWTNEKGRIVTEIPLARLVQTPREMLEKMRSENKDQDFSKNKEHKTEDQQEF